MRGNAVPLFLPGACVARGLSVRGAMYCGGAMTAACDFSVITPVEISGTKTIAPPTISSSIKAVAIDQWLRLRRMGEDSSKASRNIFLSLRLDVRYMGRASRALAGIGHRSGREMFLVSREENGRPQA